MANAPGVRTPAQDRPQLAWAHGHSNGFPCPSLSFSPTTPLCLPSPWYSYFCGDGTEDRLGQHSRSPPCQPGPGRLGSPSLLRAPNTQGMPVRMPPPRHYFTHSSASLLPTNEIPAGEGCPHPCINHPLLFTAVTSLGPSEGRRQGSCKRDGVAVGALSVSII